MFIHGLLSLVRTAYFGAFNYMVLDRSGGGGRHFMVFVIRRTLSNGGSCLLLGLCAMSGSGSYRSHCGAVLLALIIIKALDAKQACYLSIYTLSRSVLQTY